MTPLFAVALTLVVVGACLALGYQYLTRMLRDHLDELPPLDGDPLDEGWGKL